jgi:hypothetical protein
MRKRMPDDLKRAVRLSSIRRPFGRRSPAYRKRMRGGRTQ